MVLITSFSRTRQYSPVLIEEEIKIMICSRTLRQFNQDRKIGKSSANLKLNTMGSVIPQKNRLLDTNRAPIRGWL